MAKVKVTFSFNDFDFIFRQAIKRIYKAVDFGFKADYRNRPFFRSETLTCP